MSQLFNNIYQFERELGKGGFGTVFLAREDVSHRQVAIKLLRPELAAPGALQHEQMLGDRVH